MHLQKSLTDIFTDQKLQLLLYRCHVNISKNLIAFSMGLMWHPFSIDSNMFYYHHLYDSMQCLWTLLVSFSYWHRMTCQITQRIWDSSRMFWAGYFNTCYYVYIFCKGPEVILLNVTQCWDDDFIAIVQQYSIYGSCAEQPLQK